MGDLCIDPNRTTCTECNTGARSILDCTTGDVVCTGCGLVLQSQCLDESQEWRVFKEEGVGSGPQQGAARQRADGFGNDDNFGVFGELNGSIASTGMAGTSATAKALQQAQRYMESNSKNKNNVANKSQKALRNAVMKVEDLSKRLSLDGTIVRCATEFLQFLAKQDQLQGRQLDASILAVIFLACKEENAGRTYRELAVTTNALNRDTAREMVRETAVEKKIAKRAQEVAKMLESVLKKPNEAADRVRAEEIVPRLVNYLQLGQEVILPAVHICKQCAKYENVIKTKGPLDENAIAATSIFMVAELLRLEPRPSIADCARAAIVSEASVKDFEKKMSTHKGWLLADLPTLRIKGVGLLALTR